MTPLLNKLADGAFHRSDDLCTALSMSKPALLEAIQQVRAQGLVIDSVPSRGYRLSGGAQWLVESRIKAALSRSCPELSVSVEGVIDSTSRVLFAQAGPTPCVLFAEAQTAGKGRRGRTWVSPAGHNIYMSVAAEFEAGVPGALSLAIGVAVARLLKRHGVQEIQLKWPNDLWVRGHKCGGILVDLLGQPQGACKVVAGLGLNLKTPQQQAIEIDQPWADLRSVGLPDTVSRNALASQSAKAVYQAMQQPFEWLAQFPAFDALMGQSVRVLGGQEVRGIAQGIDEQGNLQVQTIDQGVVSVAQGEVSVRSNAGY